MSFRTTLNLCLKALEAGLQIELKSGHKLQWSPEHEAPGFHAIRHWRADGIDNQDEMIFQIDSDVAWTCLIAHARKMTKEETITLASNLALNEINRKKR